MEKSCEKLPDQDVRKVNGGTEEAEIADPNKTVVCKLCGKTLALSGYLYHLNTEHDLVSHSLDPLPDDISL